MQVAQAPQQHLIQIICAPPLQIIKAGTVRSRCDGHFQQRGNSVRYEPKTFDEHQQIEESVVAWLASNPVARLPLSDLDRPRAASAAPDVPASVGGMIAVSYCALIGALFVATTGSASSIFAVAIAALFVAIFFTVPRIFFAVEAMPESRPGLGKFLNRGMQTLTGHSSGPAALVQMLIVPIFLTLAVLAMGLIVSLTG